MHDSSNSTADAKPAPSKDLPSMESRASAREGSRRDGALRRCTHKFGGTSVADATRYRDVMRILAAREEAEQLVVVSAMKGVTDALIALGTKAGARDASWEEDYVALRRRHLTAASELLGANAKPTQDWLEAQFRDLHDLLRALVLLGAPSTEGLAYVQGLGEVFSAKILSDAFRAAGDACAYLDAREVLVVRHEELGVAVDWPESKRRYAAWRVAHPQPRVIVTGFVARDGEGRATTLGRNGSDYSGAIFGALSQADEIEIWTDVDGVLSADPRLVPEAVFLPALSYSEACELAYFGAKVIHPQTMAPAIAERIPIRIRNTFNPQHPGSVISERVAIDPPVKGITTIGKLALVSVEGAGMIGVPGTAERVFGALHRAGVSVVMISQGSSEHSICCVVEQREAQRAVAVLSDVFALELERGQIQSVSSTPEIAVLAAVGDGMAGTPGIAARLFDALARAGVNVRAIAQGASERNISVAIDERAAARALRAVHAGFYLSAQTVAVGLIGPGNVGRALLAQIGEATTRLRERANLDLRLTAVASSSRMLLDERGMAIDGVLERLGSDGAACDLDAFAQHLRASHLPHAVILDCSASNVVAEHYADWLAQGIHVITPNKQAGAGPWSRYAAIRNATRRGARFRYEATVGAGLPVITTLRDLIDTGDSVRTIEGIFSGTLAWLFNKYDGSVPFGQLVLEARAAGYTEPDPRDDLSGLDVARKLTILAREQGLQVSLEDVAVEGLVPAEMAGHSREDFLAEVHRLDAPMAAKLEAARARGNVLRYVAKLDDAGRASVGLVELPGDHAFAHLRLTDNIVQFTTARYANNPLIVQGPGAGPEVTAAGVFADLLRVAAGLGAQV